VTTPTTTTMMTMVITTNHNISNQDQDSSVVWHVR
jgi:hypothetical protein